MCKTMRLNRILTKQNNNKKKSERAFLTIYDKIYSFFFSTFSVENGFLYKNKLFILSVFDDEQNILYFLHLNRLFFSA